MSKSKSSPGFGKFLIHALLVFVTAGWWLLPLFIHIVGPKIGGKRATVPNTALHSVLSTFTGGLWLIGLIFYWLTRN